MSEESFIASSTSTHNQSMHVNEFHAEVMRRHETSRARVLRVRTPHGEFLTPAFMPVGTKASVNCLTPEDLRTTGTQIILGGNTFHMISSPGLEVIEALGGMHRFMGWNGPMLTDSGGFQLFSLSKKSSICKIDEEGGHFKDAQSGKIIHLTPHSSFDAQRITGADIIMALDLCTLDTADRSVAVEGMKRTHRWLKDFKAFHDLQPVSEYGLAQAVFGIIQGSQLRDLRIESTDFVVSQELDGIAVGGESIGFNMRMTLEILDWIHELLPGNKPRYTMGVGLSPQNLIDVVYAGIDMFDCVAPTRNARHGSLYCGRLVEQNDWLTFESDQPNGRIDIGSNRYATDTDPIMDGCQCNTCLNYSRGYLHFLLRSKSLAYYSLACAHNVSVMQMVCEAMRSKILKGTIK